MTITALKNVEGSDLFALPSNPESLDVLTNFASRNLGYTGKTPRNADERKNLWIAINSELAILKVFGRPGDDDLARLETTLGIEGTALSENPYPADVARVSNAVCSKARAQCLALLDAGYQP